eukprot:113753_1
MAQEKFRGNISDEDDYSDTENANKHDYQFDLDWDDNSKTIILTVNDSISKRKWQHKMGKQQVADPSKEYDKILKVVNDEKAVLDTYLSRKKPNADLRVSFIKDGNALYEWVLDEC